MENRSHTLLGWSQFVHRYFLWVLIGAYAVAAILPAPGLWIRDIRLGDISVLKAKMHVSLLLILLAALTLFHPDDAVSTIFAGVTLLMTAVGLWRFRRRTASA